MKMSRKLLILLAGGVMTLSGLTAAARNINVRGKVTMSGTGEPIYGVGIYNGSTDKLIGTTNDEGRYTVNIDENGSLLFRVMGSQDQTVDVNGQLSLNVSMQPAATELGEVVVQAKAINNQLITEPTDIDVKGNYLHVKTHVKVPHKLFSSNVRMIVQPAIYNVTRNEISYMRPVVFDGHRYAITQERMLDWDKSKDPLTPYVQVKNTGRRTDDVLTLHDSVYVKNPQDDFRCDVMSSLEDYNSIIYADTFIIARGTVNPMRFLSYSLSGAPMTDERFFPTPEMQLRDTRGEMQLSFKVGRSDLDLALGSNQSEMDRLLAQLREIESNPDMAIKSFTISGTASPEGNYDSNRRLADNRMKSAMDIILRGLSSTSRQNIEFKTEASVSSWEDVAKLLRADGHIEEAEAVETIIDSYPGNRTRQDRNIKGLPFYTKLIQPTYLPRLRNVSYQIVTQRYRYLTDEEIAELYRTNSSEMSRYEFWRLYSQAADTTEREKIIRRALEVDPKFLTGATDLAAILIDRDQPDPELLDNLLATAKHEVPDEARLNHGIALLSAGQYTKADSLLSLTPDIEKYHKARIYSAALNGRYQDVVEEIAADSPFNEVLMLLALKANDQAWEKAQKLGDSAKEEYIKAVAANRNDQYLPALTHLENAFRLDPSLRDIARVDGDVVDLLNEIDSESTQASE